MTLKPWKGICCKACWYAKRKRCKCKCHGSNHQKGLGLDAERQKNNLRNDTALTPERLKQSSEPLTYQPLTYQAKLTAE